MWNLQQIEDLKNLDSLQFKILKGLAQERFFRENFCFGGGTSLVGLGIIARRSDDLDFFTFPERATVFDHALELQLKTSVEKIVGQPLLKIAKGFQYADQAKLEFCVDSLPALKKPIQAGDLFLTHPLDTLAFKIAMLCSRDEIRDIIDIAFLANYFSFTTITVLAELYERKFNLLSAVTEEKIAIELKNKLDLFTIPTEIFLEKPQKNKIFVESTIQKLINTYAC